MSYPSDRVAGGRRRAGPDLVPCTRHRWPPTTGARHTLCASRAGATRDRGTADDAAYRVGAGEGLVTHGYEGDAAWERMDAVVGAVAGGERVVGGHHHA